MARRGAGSAPRARPPRPLRSARAQREAQCPWPARHRRTRPDGLSPCNAATRFASRCRSSRRAPRRRAGCPRSSASARESSIRSRPCGTRTAPRRAPRSSSSPNATRTPSRPVTTPAPPTTRPERRIAASRRRLSRQLGTRMVRRHTQSIGRHTARWSREDRAAVCSRESRRVRGSSGRDERKLRVTRRTTCRCGPPDWPRSRRARWDRRAW